MPYADHIPDLAEPRYLDEVGWFLCHAKYGYEGSDLSYEAQRIENSRIQMDEFLKLAGRGEDWLADKSVLSVGAGCTGDLSAWPAAEKLAADPLMIVYQRLDMLIDDARGAPTRYVPTRAESLPLLDACADLVYCRNALNHMADPAAAVAEIARVLRPGGQFFVDVDLDGIPTPDEPVVFTAESLADLLGEHFRTVAVRDRGAPHSNNSPARREVLLTHRRGYATPRLDRDCLLRKYLARCRSAEAPPIC